MAKADVKVPRVCLLATADTSAAVLYGLYDVLSTAGSAYSEYTSGTQRDKLFDVRVVAATGEPFRCFGGVMVEPHAAIDAVDGAEIVIVCDFNTPINKPPRGQYLAEIDWLKRLHAGGAILGSVCSGSLVLAEAGLLDGLEASGHWAYRDMFREHYPAVRFRVGSILKASGEQDRIVTAGGVTAWQELALYLIARVCGPRHAIETAKIFILSDHSDGQLPFAVVTPRQCTTDAVIGKCQAWIGENYASANPVAAMAARSGLAQRTFARRFLAATGLQPVDYVHTVRVEEAKQLLETESIAVEEVGRMVGYEDPTFFRRLFKRKAGLTPTAYRRKFSTIGVIRTR